jgi:hypothetical protein
MALRNIIVRDNKKKIFHKMLFLREETELLICENINTINRKYEGIFNINTLGEDLSTSYLEDQGWKEDPSLYERLVIEYNNREDKEKLLTRWK